MQLWYNGYMVLEICLQTWIQILDKAVCISHRANTLKKDLNPTILSPAIAK